MNTVIGTHFCTCGHEAHPGFHCTANWWNEDACQCATYVPARPVAVTMAKPVEYVRATDQQIEEAIEKGGMV